MSKKLKWFLLTSVMVILGLFLIYNSVTKVGTEWDEPEYGIVHDSNTDIINSFHENTKRFNDSIMNTPDMVEIREKVAKREFETKQHQLVIYKEIKKIIIDTYSDVYIAAFEIKDTSFTIDGMTFYVKMRIKPIVTVNGDEVNINLKTQSD